MWWWFACSLQTTASPPTPPPPPPVMADLSAAAFLDGCWTTGDASPGPRPGLGRDATECWKTRGSYLNGALTDARPDASPSLQLMRLAESAAGLKLHVHAAGQPPGDKPLPPMVLPLTTARPQHLVFRGGDEGYPTEAEYTLEDGTLTVHYRGRVDSRPVARTYVLRRDAVRGETRAVGPEREEARGRLDPSGP